MTFKSLRFLPSLVWSNWKSRAHTTLGRIGQKAPTATPMPRSGSLALSVGHTQAFGPPRRWIRLSLTPQPASRAARGGASPTPAGAAEREVTQEGPQGELFVARDWCRKALGGAGLADDATRPSF